MPYDADRPLQRELRITMADFVGAIDQGTTSTRFIIFDRGARIVAQVQKEHEQIYPRPGWVEHDPQEIWFRTQQVIGEAMQQAGLQPRDLAGIGITNQRETTIVWDRKTGQPVSNALVWQDTRVAECVEELAAKGGADRFRAKTGLPLATYFSALKLRWILDNVAGVRERAAGGDLLFGTVDSFLVWHLTGGVAGGIHITDVTNASRTQLMNLQSLAWDQELLDVFDVPRVMLPEIRSSSEIYGAAKLDAIAGVAIGGILGDQQAALVGQTCFQAGEAKNTYGTGCFLLMNTGTKPVQSRYGLITTVGYRFGNSDAVYALEGSVAITGALVQWMRDNFGIIRTSAEIESLARTVEDNGGVYIVPAFSGLFAPHWKTSARGVITGLTRYANKAHLAARFWRRRHSRRVRWWRQWSVIPEFPISVLRTDGGMVENDLLMQFQADILARDVVRPRVKETTALGAAYAAGLATGFFSNTSGVKCAVGG